MLYVFRSFFSAVVLAVLTLLVLVIFKDNLPVTIMLLVVIGIFMTLPHLNRTRILVFLIGFVFGPIAEAISVNAGLWEYSRPFLLGIPIWLPFVWGIAALFIVRCEEFVRSKNT